MQRVSLNRPQRKLVVPAAALLVIALVAAAQSGAHERIAKRIESVPQTHPILPALKVANQCLTALADVKDYEALFVKQEAPNGTVINSKMEIRFREEPFSVYLKYLEPSAGREVLYVDGKFANQLQVREPGVKSLLGTISLDPNGSFALGESNYPITMIGMKNMVNRLMEQWLEDTAHPDVVVKFYPGAKMGDVSCEVIEVTHPAPKAGVTYHMTRLYRDKQTGLPIRIQEYDFPKSAGAEPRLRADFTYLNVKSNTGMTDADFDTTNPRYGF